jgi:hypothetical protein
MEVVMKNHSVKIIIFIVSALLLAGCHRLEAATTVESNGSGELRIGIGFSAEERVNLEKQNNNVQDFCNTSPTPPTITATQEQRGDETWCITVTKFKNLGELRSLYEQRKGIKINRLEIRDGKFYYDLDLDTVSEASDLSAFTDITWLVTFPGTVIEQNADQLDENALTWTPTPKSGIINLHGESEVPALGFHFPPCGAALTGLGLMYVHIRRCRTTAAIP